ncbi:hypothetical protein Ciccas_002945 [Cichlidogyrus casuarinus]|uniref:Uncharacterized protein n=1 Tax=Cichlidogyrus casuarinus TaxID=1844966 RepID=A0ABD2QFS9_9PLAT
MNVLEWAFEVRRQRPVHKMPYRMKAWMLSPSKLLLKYKANLQAKNANKQTPFDVAAMMNKEAVLEFLRPLMYERIWTINAISSSNSAYTLSNFERANQASPISPYDNTVEFFQRYRPQQCATTMITRRPLSVAMTRLEDQPSDTLRPPLRPASRGSFADESRRFRGSSLQPLPPRASNQ